jgi:predicted transcriptional regulator
MDISLTTPGLLFPAITLLLLAYANRFSGLSRLIRELHHRVKSGDMKAKRQIQPLRKRLFYIKLMEILGVLGILCGLFTMLSILLSLKLLAIALLVAGIFCLIASLLFSLGELLISDHALLLELEDIENI